MREIAVQMANGIYLDNPDRGFAQIEIDQLIQQIDLIAENANFNGVALLDGTLQNVGIQTGPTANERPSIFFKENTTEGLGIDGVDVTTQANAKTAMGTLETALASISDELSRAGAYENRFGHTISVLEQTAKATKISRGRIMDADMASESTALSKRKYCRRRTPPCWHKPTVPWAPYWRFLISQNKPRQQIRTEIQAPPEDDFLRLNFIINTLF